MGIVITDKKIYPIYEENCSVNQVILEIKAERDDGLSSDNLKYSAYDDSEVYNYIIIQKEKITLSKDGVTAINEDHELATNNIWDLTFKIKIEDSAKGDYIVEEFNVPVVRVNDDPPKVTELFIYDLYKEDLIVNKKVLDIRTQYPAIFHVKDTTYFSFPDITYGRCFLTSDGAEALKDYDNNSIDLTIKIEDQFCKKIIEKTYTIPLHEGSLNKSISKKSILEEVGVTLGSDLATKIEKNNLNIDLLKNQMNSFVDDNYDLENEDSSFRNKHLAKSIEKALIKEIDYDDNDVDGYYKLNKAIFNSIEDYLNKVLKDKIEAELDNRSTLDLNLGNFCKIGPSILSGTYNYIQDKKTELTLKNLLDLRDNIEDLINKKIQLNNENLRQALNEVFTNIYDLINETRKDMVVSKFAEIGNYLFNNRKKINANEDNIKKHHDELKVNESILIDILKIFGDTSFETLQSTFAKDSTYTVYDDHETKTLKFAGTGLISKIASLDSNKLENIGDSNGWQFVDEKLKYQDNEVLSVGTNTTIKNENNSGHIYLTVNSKSLDFDSDGKLTVPGDLSANKCNCTATSAQYADLAEYYEADKRYSYGTILVIGGNKEVTIAKNAQAESRTIIGVVSKKPGFILNNKFNPSEIIEKNNRKFALIALKGRTPVKIEEGLEVKKGEKLYLSFKESGKAGKLENKFYIGTALESVANIENSDCEACKDRKDVLIKDEVEIFVS